MGSRGQSWAKRVRTEFPLGLVTQQEKRTGAAERSRTLALQLAGLYDLEHMTLPH